MRTHLGLGLAMVLTAACSNSVFTSTDDAGNTGDGGNVDPINGGDASADAGGGKVDAVAPPGCDQSKLPTDDLCVVNDAEGVFVSSSTGSATGDGSRAKPLASLNAAIALANKYSMRVYACAETYAESVAFADGTSVFGYFDCKNGWTANAQSHAKIQSPTSPAATATNITHATRVEAVDIFAPDFTDKSQSSIALIANASPALLIKGATIHAGTGGKGDNGVDGIPLKDSGTKSGGNGTADKVCTGQFCLVSFVASGGSNTCVGESGHDPGAGGAGGSGGVFVSNGTTWVVSVPSSDGLPTVATTATNAGGTVGVAPSNGVNGVNGADGESGSSFGSLSASGYVPSDGTSGVAGTPGQGGGGAAGMALYQSDDFNPKTPSYNGKTGYGDYGAGGGAGGCPGLPATIGKGGGASIAVVAVQSPFTLDTVIVQTSNGGAGGAAGNSSAITVGGSGGAKTTNTFVGGSGGNGGYAGVSGNGAGGPSIAIAYQGTSPVTQLATTITLGQGGSGVAAVTDSSNGKTIPASVSGMNLQVYLFGA